MDITFDGTFKSITSFSWNNVPTFSILTGTNGSGKSQLMQLIYDTVVDSIAQRNSRVKFTNESFKKGEITYLTSEWSLENSYPINLSRIQQEIEGLYSQFQQVHQTQHQYKLDFYFNELANKAGKARQEMSKEEFEKAIAYDFYQNEQQITHQIARIFLDYNISFIEKRAKGVSEEEIIIELGPKPWIVLNQIIQESKIPFEFNNPEATSIKDTFTLQIKDTEKNCIIDFADLSSGEKVLVSLVIYLYNSQEKKFFPRFLLMDEPDAHLHPSMAKQFLDVVSNVFVATYNIRVIMCTHSPSTVALAPAESLFIVNKTGVRIEKTSKDKALKILTAGVPSFSVNYQNRRQVFVESHFDVLYYEKFYQKLSDKLIPEVSLSFISSGETRTNKNGVKVSNCEQVVNITNILREAGNKFIWGIIDWDTKNEESEYIKVLGDGNRYSIESYILDPVFIAAILIREKIIQREDLGLSEHENYTDLKKFDSKKLQSISDYVVQKIESLINPQNVELITVELVNGNKIDIPNWYLNYQGHELEDLVLKVFPALNAIKKGKEEALKIEILNKVIDDIPELICIDVLKALQKVQSF